MGGGSQEESVSGGWAAGGGPSSAKAAEWRRLIALFLWALDPLTAFPASGQLSAIPGTHSPRGNFTFSWNQQENRKRLENQATHDSGGRRPRSGSTVLLPLGISGFKRTRGNVRSAQTEIKRARPAILFCGRGPDTGGGAGPPAALDAGTHPAAAAARLPIGALLTRNRGLRAA